ncbi:MAG: hypothetical protein JKP97_20200, partial [Rhodobacteraceae bacterium]|jgi:hypothetical protein|nr:hypothetical protein [Paracoccaceae bacterium]
MNKRIDYRIYPGPCAHNLVGLEPGGGIAIDPDGLDVAIRKLTAERDEARRAVGTGATGPGPEVFAAVVEESLRALPVASLGEAVQGFAEAQAGFDARIERGLAALRQDIHEGIRRLVEAVHKEGDLLLQLVNMMAPSDAEDQRAVIQECRETIATLRADLDRTPLVWMPRGMQGHREPPERVIECALVSGL